jgi:hypothetical protein
VPIKARKQPKCASFQAKGAQAWGLETRGWRLGAGDLRKRAVKGFLPRSAVWTRTTERAGNASRLSNYQLAPASGGNGRNIDKRPRRPRLHRDFFAASRALEPVAWLPASPEQGPRAANGLDALFICELRSSGGAICGCVLTNLGRVTASRIRQAEAKCYGDL